MKLLWNSDLKLNTVHVHDVVRALWQWTTHGEKRAVFNLAEKNDTGWVQINLILPSLVLTPSLYL